MDRILSFWYDWGVFLGVFLAAAIAIYIFFDSQQAVAPGGATWPRAISLIGLVLTLPSLYYRLTQIEEFDVLTNLFANNDNFSLFLYLALAGLVLAVIALIYYLAGSRGQEPVAMYSAIPTPPPPPVEPVAPQPRPLAATQPVSQEPPPQAWLVVRSGPRVGAQFGLGMSRPNVIGRDPNKADIIIDEDSVSREHARVRYENGQFVIYDMASTSGTYVNGSVVQRQMLYDDDRINLGRIELVYKKV
ncbi:MAG: FHA domain-containing protein [Anaerolineales bacterium]|uniref:FHA domain-containing protein n=1 Tax=Promineifilum sp. TaxID=2664178 RepID=UPI001D24B0A3|nr:FHA domain-containing protein [Anaerolineales bacterium]MCO5181866.1 FHA domain-containing protein [Promineifilum sp.]